MIYTNLLRSFKSIPSHLQTKNKEELALIVPSFMDEAVIGEDGGKESCAGTQFRRCWESVATAGATAVFKEQFSSLRPQWAR